MSFTFSSTEIEGLIIVSTHEATDYRGAYRKSFEKNEYKKAGIMRDFVESSDIFSKKGVIRGLHYQTEDSQAKLLHVIKGSIFDVALDLREGSNTFGLCHFETLRQGDNKALFIPEGFAHGFLALEEDTIFSYQCAGRYIPAACGGIRWNDERLNIPWPLDGASPILSEKDSILPTFEDYCKKRGIKQ